MGRRSRKRSVAGTLPAEREAASVPASARPAPAAPTALRRRVSSAERPPAPWGSFPLGELMTLAGIVLLVVGFATGNEKPLFAGFALVALAAAELAAREHFAGFRSHSALLGLILGAVTAVVLVVAGAPRPVQVGLAILVFLGGFLLMRRTFKDRAGGLGFRA